LLGTEGRSLGRLGVPPRWAVWLRSAVSQDEAELAAAIRPSRGRWPDAAVAAGALAVVIMASVIMERAASALGQRYAVPQIVVGGLVLAAVTSLPNAVAAVHLAARGRGAATMSTALNSNTLNVVAGLLLPGVLIGLGPVSGQARLVALWYAGLTVAVLTLAWRHGGLGRAVGLLVIAAYAAFAASVLVSGYAPGGIPALAAVLGASIALLAIAALGPFPSLRGKSLLSGWPVGRLWALSLLLPVLVAAVDAALGPAVVLIGLLIVGPCSALLTGRWLPTALTGLWVIGLAVVLGIPDGIWGTVTHLAFISAVTSVALTTIAAAALIGRARSARPGS
jgi:hypothetical protein